LQLPLAGHGAKAATLEELLDEELPEVEDELREVAFVVDPLELAAPPLDVVMPPVVPTVVPLVVWLDEGVALGLDVLEAPSVVPRPPALEVAELCDPAPLPVPSSPEEDPQ
jgi:hypothetical protein